MDSMIVTRYEFKYLLSPARAPDVRHFLLNYCVPDVHTPGQEWYGIQSLYLDTGDFLFYRQSSENAMERMKLRVRAYASGDGPVKLEVKRRVNDLVTKRSLLFARPSWEQLRCHGLAAVPPEELTSLGDFGLQAERLRAAPKLLVDYERQAFHSDIDDYVRITFDRRIRCQPMNDWSTAGSPRRWRLIDNSAPGGESAYVLELKFQRHPPLWLRDLVTRFGLARHGFSKYARGVRSTLAERDPGWDLRQPGHTSPLAWRAA